MTDPLAAITSKALVSGAAYMVACADGFRAAVYHDGDKRFPYRVGAIGNASYSDAMAHVRALINARGGLVAVVKMVAG